MSTQFTVKVLDNQPGALKVRGTNYGSEETILQYHLCDEDREEGGIGK